MPKNDSILLNRMDYSSGIAVGIWDGSTPGMVKAIHPHRHDHYTCMLIETGPLEVLFDFEHLIMPAGTLFVSPPGQVHQVLNTLGATGYYLSFESHHIAESAQASLDKSLAETMLVALSGSEHEWFRSIIGSMIKLQDLNDFSYREVEQPLLSAFVAQAVLCYERKILTKSASLRPRAVSITKKFRNLVKSDFRNLKRPSDYANKLHISVPYLNDTVKKVTGLSASELIQKEILSEAQRLLYYSEMSVKEISYQLGYQDTKYFIRLFTKKAGCSPGEYRRAYSPKADQRSRS